MYVLAFTYVLLGTNAPPIGVRHIIILIFVFFYSVSEDQLAKNVSSMKKQITKLEKDIGIFAKTKDEEDKFSEKLSISFLITL